MKRLVFLFGLLPYGLVAQIKTPRTGIKPTINASHIASIDKNGIAVVNGSTHLFTVDTPEDKGLVSTNTTVADLLREITSIDSSIQTYKVTDKHGAARTEGVIETGDRLIVTAQRGGTQSYSITAQPMALGGQLHLQQEAVTLNTSRELTLHFTAGQRTPDATVKIYIPAGINVTMDNTTVNVIGRGTVKLKDLSKQSIGRVGNKYPYTRVGDVVINKIRSGETVIQFTHLDLRPANGPDLEVVISNVKLRQPGNYSFKTQYTTAKPEVLTSPIKTATLRVERTISDFQRIADEKLRDDYTTAHFKWTALNNGNTHLFQSTDDGKTWQAAQAIMDLKKGSATVKGLVPGKLYAFKLRNINGESNITGSSK